MNRIAKSLAAVALVLSPLAAAAPAAAQVYAEIREKRTVIGMLATGSDAAKKRFEDAAKAAGYNTARSKNNAGEDEVMVLTFGKDQPRPFWTLYNAALGGSYGVLDVNVIVVPLDADPNAKDFLDQARIYDSEYVTLPKN